MKIKELQIYTKNLEKQIDFYTNIIGLELLERSKRRAVFQIGESVLTLEQNDNAFPYHFAINIPCNQENEALNWLKQRVAILDFEMAEVQDFVGWNAKAIYFYDMDRNIVEFIARKNLNNQSNQEFSGGSLVEISEIGMPVNHIKSTFETLTTIVPLPIFDGAFEKFCAIGDEYGLFICINKNEKEWFPTGDKAYSADFQILLENKKQEFYLQFVDGKIRTIANK